MTTEPIVGRSNSAKGSLSDRLLARNYLLASLTNVLLLGIGLYTGTIVARVLGPTGRGEFAIIVMWGQFLATGLGQLGIPVALTYYAGRVPEEAGGLLTSSWVVIASVSAVWMCIGWFALPILLEAQDPSLIRGAQLFMVLLLPLAVFYRTDMVLQGRLAFGRLGMIRLQLRIIYAVLLTGIAIAGIATSLRVAGVLLVASAITAASTILYFRSAGIRLRKPSLAYASKLTRYGIRAMLGSVPEQLNGRLDQLVMAVVLEPRAMGLYAVSVTWSMMLGPFVRAVGDVLFPHVAASSDEPERRKLFATMVRTSLLLSVLINTVVITLTPWLLPLIFGSSFASAVTTAQILLLAANFLYLKLVLSDGLKGLGRPEAGAYAELFALALTIVFLYLLLPRYGIIGASVTSLIAYSSSSLILAVYSVRREGFSARRLLIVQPQDFHYAATRGRQWLKAR